MSIDHCLYVGATMTGKTTLARLRAREVAKTGRAVVIYDPVGTATAGGDWPQGSNVLAFDDFERFMRWVHRNGDADLFIDEAGDHFGVSDKENHWLLRRGRHYGYAVHLISQRPKMLAPNVRTQCSVAYIFRVAHEDLRELAADLGHDAPETTLDKGDFLVLRSDSPAIAHGNVFDLLDRTKR
jgi:hypothetical protein